MNALTKQAEHGNRGPEAAVLEHLITREAEWRGKAASVWGRTNTGVEHPWLSGEEWTLQVGCTQGKWKRVWGLTGKPVWWECGAWGALGNDVGKVAETCRHRNMGLVWVRWKSWRVWSRGVMWLSWGAQSAGDKVARGRVWGKVVRDG